MIKNIFFDFDGVLAESVNVKTEAFYQLYLPFGEDITRKVVNHHRLNGGVSRFEKFKIYHETFLKVKMTDKLMNELTKKFSELVKNGVINSAEVDGASDFLKHYKKDYLMFIITGTPTEEMNEILKSRKMNNYFEAVFGSPTKKDIWAKHILEKWNLKSEETIFIGDAKSDFEGAKKNNIHFILRPTPENKEVFKGYNGLKINDLTELKKTINTLNA